MKRQHAIFEGVIALAVTWGALVAPTAQAVTIAGWDFNGPYPPAPPSFTNPSAGSGSLTFDGFLPHYSLANGGTTGGAGDNALAVYNIYNLTSGSMTFQISTFGYDQIGMSFAAKQVGEGFNQDALSFSVDSGSGFVPVATVDQTFGLNNAYAIYTPVLTGLGLENKTGVQFKMTFDGAAMYDQQLGPPGVGYAALDDVVFTGHALATNAPPVGNPEPVTGTLALAGLGALGLALLRRRAA